MKNRLFSILMLLSILFGANILAQHPDPNWADVEFPNLMITECRLNQKAVAYFEITNMEDTAVDLSNITMFNGFNRNYSVFTPGERYYGKAPWLGQADFSGTLEAGASLVCAAIFTESDSTQVRNNNLRMIDVITWPSMSEGGYANPELLCANNPSLLEFFNDTTFMALATTPYKRLFEPAGGKNQFSLAKNYEVITPANDSTAADTLSSYIIIDVANVWIENFTSLAVPGTSGTCAGVVDAGVTHTWVRKTSGVVTADWINESRGIATEDSQWWVVPSAQGTDVYSSVGNHGDFSISVEAVENTTAEVNNEDLTITVPWEALRGMSVTDKYIDFGPGMGWNFFSDTISADSAYTRVQDGDILTVYAFGDDLETATYTFKVLPSTSDLAVAASRVGTVGEDLVYRTVPYFTITEDVEGMDSVLNIANQLRIDTLYKYVEIPTDASKEIVFIDGDVSRVDLKDGDILRVTSKDNSSVKDYYLQVNDYVTSVTTTLGAITWPDYDKDYYFEWEYLMHDTLPEFASSNRVYNLKLPDYSTTVPALVAHASDLNSRVSVDRATTIFGSLEQRTTTFTVYSEDSDTVFSQYSVVFEIDMENQYTDAQPFISAQLTGRYNLDGYIEVFNPNDGVDALDMSRYLIVNAPLASDPANAITNYNNPATTAASANYFSYIPGYKFNYANTESGDFNDYTWKDGVVGGVTLDANVDPQVMPGDVFVVGAFSLTNNEARLFHGSDSTYLHVDINLTSNADFPNVDQSDCVATVNWSKWGIFLYYIDNDSILAGTKGIWESADDYVLVDRLTWDRSVDTDLNGYPYKWNGQSIVRKPHIQKGTLLHDETFHHVLDSCDWMNYSRNGTFDQTIHDKPNKELGDDFGSHIMNPITWHYSTVTSDVYAVDLGFEGDLSIVGEVATHSVETFISNLNKADPLQSITIMKGDAMKDSTDLMEDGDMVTVLSADSTNTTVYMLQARALSSNTDLESVGDLGIVVDNTTLTITGFDYTKAVADVLAGVAAVDPLSIINVLDADDHLVSLLTLSKDTLLADPLVVTTVFNGIKFEVVAEGGAIATYQLLPTSSSSDAYITSDLFTIVEDAAKKSINAVGGGYAVSTFLSYLTPSGNATLKILNKAGAERTGGSLQLDDYVQVTSEDGTVIVDYYINFYGEEDPDGPSNLLELRSNSTIDVYPNPTTSLLNLKNIPVGSVIQVISLNGSLVHSTISTNEAITTIDMSSLDRGMYLVRAVQKDSSSTVKVIKQ